MAIYNNDIDPNVDDWDKSEEAKISKEQLDSELKSYNNLIKELLAFIEYEEAMTVDTRSQQRMSAKLRELGLWPSE